MKSVAIIGAGISGLSCAIELERHGIKPVIFEKRAHVGETLNYSLIWPRIMNRPIMDPIKYLKKQYGLTITPTNPLKRMVVFSSNKNAVERGKLGYIFRRGTHDYALENQLLNYINAPVTFNHYIEVDDIKKDFDYVVVATSSSTEAEKIGIWTGTFNSIIRLSVVVGKFDPTEVIIWQNAKYAKNAFCYLIPNGPKDASLVQIVNGITTYEIEYYWKEFIFTENLNYYISSHTDTEHDCGFANPPQYENVIFIGNAGGFTDDILGCGGLNAVESGIMAARAIAYGKDYGTLVEPIYRSIAQLHELRKAMNTLDNLELDRLITILGIPVIKNVIYNNPFFKMQQTASLAEWYNNHVKFSRTSVK